jgi:putative transferase (TIGR04331 family)
VVDLLGSMVLITTALQETFPKDTNEKALFLGEWCKVYNKKPVCRNFDSQTMPYHWDDRKKLYTDYQNIQIIYEKILCELSSKLNQIHQVNYSLRYWRILIGPWLGYFTQTLFDRWFMLSAAFENDQKYHCYTIRRKPFSFTPNNMSHFQQWFITDDWNEAIYGQLMDLCWASQVNITWIEGVNQTPKPFTKKTLIKKYIKEKALPFLNKFSVKDNNYFFISSYLSLKTELKLQIRLGQIPNLWATQSPPIVRPCAKQRKWQLSSEKASDFEKVLRKMIPMHIPTAYLEGYLTLNKAVENLSWPKNPKSIFTSNAYSGDDLFKAWAAKKTEGNTPLVIGQHGGHFGMNPFSFHEEHQIKIADKWLSWGWHDKNRKNITPVGNLKAIGGEVDYSPEGGALMVEMVLPRYSYHLYAAPIANQYLDYFNDQKIFLSSLPIELRQQVLLRLSRSDYGWNQADRWQNSMPEVNIDLGRKNIKKLIKKSRLYISTYNATTYLESLTWNVPTIMFWNPEYWELNEQAKPYFELLEKVGIFHTTPQSAAKKMIEIWNDVDGWWYSNETQIARKVFIDQYARLPEEPLNLLQDIFEHNIEGQ